MPAVNQSNGMQKMDKGVMPDPLMSALNAAMTQFLGGTSYNGEGPSSLAPPRVMPNGMEMQVPPQVPMPEPNPNFHAGSPLEFDMGRLFAQAMQGEAPPPMMPMTAMGEQPPVLPPTPAKAPPVPAKKPPAKPERAKPKGNEPKDEPKLKTPPPSSKKRAIASK